MKSPRRITTTAIGPPSPRSPARRALLGAAAAVAAGAVEANGDPKVFAFAVIGDVPYGENEARFHEQVLERLDADCAFAIHVGDLKGGGESCADALLGRRRRLLDRHSALPLVYVPGDNDWFDCSRQSNGRYDPLERLQHLRRLFFEEPRSLGPRPFRIVRQSDVDPGFPYPENLRWTHGSMDFVTLNLPGGVDVRALDPVLAEAVRQLMRANERWLRAAFARAGSTLVIAAHADPRFGRAEPAAASGEPLPAFRRLLRELCGGFRGQVLLVHGDTHLFRNDRPLRDAEGRTVANLTRVESFGSPFATQWVHVRVTPGADEPFFVNTRELRSDPWGR